VRVAAHNRKIANRRRDFAHQLSRRLVNDHDLIVYEDLKITNMTRRPKPRPDQQGLRTKRSQSENWAQQIHP
jgi:putative transposase